MTAQEIHIRKKRKKLLKEALEKREGRILSLLTQKGECTPSDFHETGGSKDKTLTADALASLQSKRKISYIKRAIGSCWKKNNR